MTDDRDHSGRRDVPRSCRRASTSRRAHDRRLPQLRAPTRATQVIRAALEHVARTRCRRRSRTPRCSAAAAPGSRPGPSGASVRPSVWPRYIVVNGDESEPGTYKDRVLMERDPHQLIEGCLIAAYAIGAAQVFLYVRGEMPHAQERIAAALNEAYAANLVGRNILGTDFSVDIVLHWGAGAYIVGEETALIESLEGNRGMPRLKPPFFPAAKGLYLKPTIVNNVETLSNLPWLLHHGVDAFQAVGTEASPGTRLIALSGHVNQPGVYEIPQGTTTFRDAVRGRALRRRASATATSSRCSSPAARRPRGSSPSRSTCRSRAERSARPGSMLGSGAIVVMDETTDAVQGLPARRPVLRPRVVRQVHAVPRGHDVGGEDPPAHPRRPRPPERHRPAARRRRQHPPGPVPGRRRCRGQGLEAVPFPPRQTTICPLGPSSVAPITSAIRRFRHEFEAKITKRSLIPVARVAEHLRS